MAELVNSKDEPTNDIEPPLELDTMCLISTNAKDECDAIAMDLNFIKDEISPAAVLTATREFVTIVIM